jgi:hypothetical protein
LNRNVKGAVLIIVALVAYACIALMSVAFLLDGVFVPTEGRWQILVSLAALAVGATAIMWAGVRLLRCPPPA